MTRTVFVSSTFVDLQPHRKVIWGMLRAFDVTVRGMEEFGARKTPPLQTCLAEVDLSDIYVGVIAFRQGSIEPKSGKSFTQLEYERANDLSKDILIYLIDEENARVQAKFMDRGEAQDKLESFKSGPGSLHFIYSRLTIAWIKLHSPTCEGKQFDPEIFLKGIQHGIFNTVIGG